MSFIKKIFEGNFDESVHQQFQKFSRGTFDNRALINAKVSKDVYSLNTGAEFARDLIIACAKKLGSERVLVEGALIAAIPLEGFEYKEKKSAIGINKYFIENEMSGDGILELIESVPKAFFGLSFKSGDFDLKIKSKAPKSSKGASSKKKNGEILKADFCKLKTGDKEIIKDFIFDVGSFKKVDVNHTFIIEEIVLPSEEECDPSDFAKVRELAKRKGRVIRNLSIDGNEKVSEKEFIA